MLQLQHFLECTHAKAVVSACLRGLLPLARGRGWMWKGGALHSRIGQPLRHLLHFLWTIFFLLRIYLKITCSK